MLLCGRDVGMMAQNFFIRKSNIDYEIFGEDL